MSWCWCAEDLLGIDEVLAKEIESALLEDSRLDRVHLRRYREYSERELIRPGFTRINLPYFMKKETALFILESIVMVAEHGWKLLPKYIFNPETGEWRHHQHQIFKDRRWLGSISYSSGEMKYPDLEMTKQSDEHALNYQECLAKAEKIFRDAAIVRGKHKLDDQSLLLGDAEKLRWFLLPSEAQSFLRGETRGTYPKVPPFTPLRRSYLGNNTVDDLNNKPDCVVNIEENSSSGKYVLSNVKKTEIKDEEYHGTDQNVYSSDQVLLKNGNDDNMLLTENISTDEQGQKLDKKILKDLDLGISVSSNAKSTLSVEMLETGNTCVDKSSTLEKKKRETLHCSKSKNGLQTIVKQEWKVKFHNPPRQVFNVVVKAVEEFHMINNGDRILVCVSGGKDSLSMLHTLHQYQFYAKTKGINFTFGAATVDPGSSAYDPSPLKAYMHELGVEYFYEVQGIIKQASELPVCESICSFCSRMKRGRLYACARRNGFNVLAIGQHLDDIAESFLMSVFHNGLLRTMKANYHVSENDLRVIRPMTYVREKDLRDFAEKVQLPVIAENCPACFEAPKERHRVKQLLATQELLFPCLFKSVLSAVKPLMARKRTKMENKETCLQDLSSL